MQSDTKYYRSGVCTFRRSMTMAIGLIIGFFGWEPHLGAQVPIIKNIQITQPDKIGISNKDMEDICIAAISVLFDQPTTIIHVDGIEEGMMHVSYTLPADGTVWRYKCRIEGKKIIWATKDGAGRTESDEQVTFQLTQDEILITVTFPDGSENHSRFPR